MQENKISNHLVKERTKETAELKESIDYDKSMFVKDQKDLMILIITKCQAYYLMT